LRGGGGRDVCADENPVLTEGKVLRARTVAITDCDHVAMNEEKKVFSDGGVEMVVYRCKTEEDLLSSLQDYEAVGNQYAPFTERVFANLPHLRLVVRYGVGVNNIDLKAATERGVRVCNVPDYGIQEVSAHALALMMALTRKLFVIERSMRRGEWNYEVSIPIARYSEQTVGIVGLGRIGKNFARLVRPFDGRVIATDPLYPADAPPEFSFVEMTGLEDLLENSDVVSIHCPLETAFHLIGRPQLKKMKRNAFLINVSRGGILEESALEEALRERWIAGAACDVLEKEPPESPHPLLKLDNFLCTPHVAWYSEQASSDLKRKLAEELLRYVNGEPLRYPLN
jgi:D-3-phosphoglycerate dehydrogenase